MIVLSWNVFPCKHFQPSPMLVGKARRVPQSGVTERYFTVG